MKIVKHIAVIFLLMIFLFSTMGISFLQHICNSSQNMDVTVYPGLFNAPVSSCCGEEEAEYAYRDQTGTEASSVPMNIDASPCCISINSFLRLEFASELTEKLVIKSISVLTPQYLVPLEEPTVNEILSIPASFFQFYSPPISGKRLIHFLHQAKIPAHLSIA